MNEDEQQAQKRRSGFLSAVGRYGVNLRKVYNSRLHLTDSESSPGLRR